jgi:hypothetical protein
MRLQTALECLPETLVPSQFDRLRASVPFEWIEEALTASGAASVRRRRMPAEQVVWLVVGMALLRNESIERIVDQLDLALPGRSDDEPVAKSSIAQARQRIGVEPLAHLFSLLAMHWATESANHHRWRGLALYGVDGSTGRVADSPENRAHFGGQSAGDRGASGYPMFRLLAIVAVRSHLLSAVRFGDYATGELTLAQELWQELPDDSLTLMDRGFLVCSLLTSLAASGKNKHWLTRAKSTTRMRTVKRLGNNDEIVEIVLSDQTRRLHPSLPQCWLVRAIRYQRKGFRPSLLLTSLVDADAYPAEEVVELYHERWEVEIAFDEVKTHMLERQETIRSRTAAGVIQELWGLCLAYNLVRVEMERMADEIGVAPTRISFVSALSLIRYALQFSSGPRMAPGTIPKRLRSIRDQMKRLMLPARRERSYPRAVKIKMSNYTRKRPPTGRGAK